MRNKTLHLAASTLMTLLLLVGCAASPEVGSDAASNANFSGYRSFAVLPRERVVASLPGDAMRNPLVISRIEDEVKTQMQRKGYVLTDLMSADMVVDFTIGARERIDIHTSPGGWGMGPGPVVPRGNDIDVRQYREGTLVIDVFDAHTRNPVWHGWAQKQLTAKDIHQSSAPIREAVESVLAKFPQAS